jgi:putative spermidine/putrescine transport system permease protein
VADRQAAAVALGPQPSEAGGPPRLRGLRPSRQSRPARSGWRLFFLPLAVFLLVVFVAAQLYFYRLGFAKFLAPGLMDTSVTTLDNFQRIFTDSFYLTVIARTLLFAALVLLTCLVLGFPLAYVISRSSRFRSPLMSAVIITSFTSVIIKVLGWRVLLGDTGPVNTVLQALHVVNHPIRLVNNLTGAVIGTSQAVLPFMVLLLVPVIDQVPRQLEDAAAGLGAPRWRIVLGIILPSCRVGVVGGALVTFAYAMGSFTTPALLGGQGALILPLAIREQFTSNANYAFAAALALVLMVLAFLLTVAAMGFTRSERSSL